MDASNMSPMGSISKLYRAVTRLYTTLPYRFSKSGASLPAVHYFFEVTRRCNLRCKMCQYIQWLQTTPTRVQAEGELTTGEWLSTIDQTTPLSMITFTGGEVFVRKDFMQLLEHACSKRRVHFISNATMFTEARAQWCAELAPRRPGGRGLNFMGTSIDGTRAVHDTIRAQKGSFDKALNGIAMLSRFRSEMKKKSPLIHVNTVIQDENLDCLPELPRIVAEAGCDVLNLLTEMRSMDIQEVGHVDPGQFTKSDITMKWIDRRRLDESLRRTLRAAREAGVEVRLPRMPYEELLNHYDGGYDLRNFECRAIWLNLYVGSKGGVYPCFIQKVGNVREQGLKEIWNGPELREFRRRRRDGGFALCRGCCELEYAGPASEHGTVQPEHERVPRSTQRSADEKPATAGKAPADSSSTVAT